MRTMRWVVTYSPSGQRSASSTRTCAPPSWIKRVAQGSGTQAPSMSPAMNAASVAVGLGLDRHVAAAGVVGLVALVVQPGSERDVLGVAELRRGRMPATRSGKSMSSRTTRAAPPECVPDTMRMASPSDWAKALIAGVGPDEPGVERAVEECLDHLRAGVEGARLEDHVRSERLGQEPFSMPTMAGGVADLERAESEGDRIPLFGALPRHRRGQEKQMPMTAMHVRRSAHDECRSCRVC